MFTGRTKPIRIIGDQDNLRPDKWSATVIMSVAGLSSWRTGFYPTPVHVIEFTTVKRRHNVYCILTDAILLLCYGTLIVAFSIRPTCISEHANLLKCGYRVGCV
jgi:hypothetical protein